MMDLFRFLALVGLLIICGFSIVDFIKNRHRPSNIFYGKSTWGKIDRASYFFVYIILPTLVFLAILILWLLYGFN